MKVLIAIDQKASIASGFDAPNSTEVIELSPQQIPDDLRGWFADHYSLTTGAVKCEARRMPNVWSAKNAYWSNELTLAHPITTERVIAALFTLRDEHARRQQIVDQKLAEDRAAELKRVSELIAAGPKTLTGSVRYGESTLQYQFQDWDFRCDPDFRDVTDPLWASAPKLNPTREDARRAAEEEVKKMEEVRIAANQARILEVIAEHSPADLKRVKAGMMPPREIWKIFQDYLLTSVLAPTDPTGPSWSEGSSRWPALYTPFCAQDVEHNEDCEQMENCEVEYDTDVMTALSSAQFDRLQVLQSAFPDAKITCVRHAAKRSCCEGWQFRWAFHAEIKDAGMVITRDFEAPAAD